MSAWMFLSIAILLEICGTFFLKLSDGFARWHWAGAAMGCYWLCFAALAPALRDLPVGVVYAVWAGVGILGGVGLGVYVFGEMLGATQYGFIVLIAAGAIGLRLTTQA